MSISHSISDSDNTPDALLSSAIAFVLLVPPLLGGLAAREQYLPFFCIVAAFFLSVALRAVRRRERLLDGPVDILVATLAGLYCLTLLWARSNFTAVDGALKNLVYLMAFLLARKTSKPVLMQRLLIAGGVLATSASYLSAAGIVAYPGAVRGGSFQGTIGYENSLAAYAMFALFILFQIWSEAEPEGKRGTLTCMGCSIAGFLLLGAIVLSSSRATWVICAFFLIAQLVALPGPGRSGLLARMLVVFGAVALTAGAMDAALAKPNPVVFRIALLIGILLSAVFEGVRIWATGLARMGDMVAYPTRWWLLVGAMTCLRLSSVAWTPGTHAATPAVTTMVPQVVVSGLKSISLSDRSLLARVIMTRDAWKIAADNPFGAGAGGWNALYPQYQLAPYTFTETHNHFAQVLVEAGFPGLLIYLAMWAVLAFAVVAAYRNLRGALVTGPKATGTGDAGGAGGGIAGGDVSGDASSHSLRLSRVIAWSAAVFSLGAHSAVDYDLSFPAISITLLAGIALLLSELTPLVSVLRARLRQTAVGPPPDTQADSGFAWLLPPQTVAVIVSLMVFLVSGRFYLGTVAGRAGEAALAAAKAEPIASIPASATIASPESVLAGRRLLSVAMALDSLNPEYPLRLASSFASAFATTGSLEDREATLYYLNLAEAVDPLNVALLTAKVQVLLGAGVVDDSVETAARLVRISPSSRRSYELAMECVRAGLEAFGTAEALDRYATYAVDWAASLRARRSLLTGLDARVFGTKGLDMTPKMALVAGQAMLIEGDAAAAREYLTLAATDKALSATATALLSGIR